MKKQLELESEAFEKTYSEFQELLSSVASLGIFIIPSSLANQIYDFFSNLKLLFLKYLF